MCESTNGSFTMHGTGTGTTRGKRRVSILRYVQYTLHRDRDRDRDRNKELLFSIVPIPVPVPVPCNVYEPSCYNAYKLGIKYVFLFRVVKSINADYKVGTEWVCFFGWRTHTVFNPSKQFDNLPPIPGQCVCVCVCVYV